jgi:hypothetical protein
MQTNENLNEILQVLTGSREEIKTALDYQNRLLYEQSKAVVEKATQAEETEEDEEEDIFDKLDDIEDKEEEDEDDLEEEDLPKDTKKYLEEIKKQNARAKEDIEVKTKSPPKIKRI